MASTVIMDIPEADLLPIATLDVRIEYSRALWVDEISETAIWPEPDDFESAGDYQTRRERFDEYLFGPESREISRILFQLKATRVDSVERMQALIDRHNESIAEDLEDIEYIRQSGVNPERLRQAIFSSESEKEVLLNNVARFGAGVLHKSAYGRFLVRHANVNRVNATLDVLRDAGLVEVRKGANNADIVQSDGRLEDAHFAYLTRIKDAALEANS